MQFFSSEEDIFIRDYEQAYSPVKECSMNFTIYHSEWKKRTQRSINERDCGRLILLNQEILGLNNRCPQVFREYEEFFNKNQEKIENDASLWTNHISFEQTFSEMRYFDAKAKVVLSACS
ncbi:MAG: hypothetical protein ABH950_05735 [Candidatus Altiarchaeota archaeon]